MSIMSNDPENPKNKSIRLRRCSVKKLAEPQAEKKEQKGEKLIQTETAETGKVSDS